MVTCHSFSVIARPPRCFFHLFSVIAAARQSYGLAVTIAISVVTYHTIATCDAAPLGASSSSPYLLLTCCLAVTVVPLPYSPLLRCLAATAALPCHCHITVIMPPRCYCCVACHCCYHAAVPPPLRGLSLLISRHLAATAVACRCHICHYHAALPPLLCGPVIAATAMWPVHCHIAAILLPSRHNSVASPLPYWPLSCCICRHCCGPVIAILLLFFRLAVTAVWLCHCYNFVVMPPRPHGRVTLSLLYRHLHTAMRLLFTIIMSPNSYFITCALLSCLLVPLPARARPLQGKGLGLCSLCQTKFPRVDTLRCQPGV